MLNVSHVGLSMVVSSLGPRFFYRTATTAVLDVISGLRLPPRLAQNHAVSIHPLPFCIRIVFGHCSTDLFAIRTEILLVQNAIVINDEGHDTCRTIDGWI